MLLVLLSSESGHAQRPILESTQHWYVGGRGGVSVISERIDPNPLFQTISGQTNFLWGAELDYAFSNVVALCLQPLYEQKGYHNVFALPSSLLSAGGTGGTQFNFSITTDLNATYLEVPLVLRVTFPSGNWRPYLFAGPSFGVLLSASGKSHLALSTGGLPFALGIDSTENEKGQLTSTDISGYLGSGIAYNFPGGATLFIEAGYAFGLASIWNNAHTGILSDPFSALGALGGLGGTGTTRIPIPSLSQTQTVKSHDFRIAVGILFSLD
jgi:hypothetical protein